MTNAKTPTPRTREKSSRIQGKLKPHDPFELIRWLALSQTDPRKALAELVQNSLDASARNVSITRYRTRGTAYLRIYDDGEGVIPELSRPEALRYIATHIGHSRKRALSPQERLQLMTQGQYGIGLLGFWSLGDVLEMRSSVPGQKAHRLVLYRDQATFRIEPLTGRLPLEERFTEIVVSRVHADAQRVLAARRAAEYLAAELRGQLLAREVSVVIEDRISRGLAQKRMTVKPPRFLGERIEGLERLDVPGHPPIRLEVYWTGEGAPQEGGTGLHVYSAGTQVAEGFHTLASLGLDRAPWTDVRLTGLVDFPAFRIAPGSRRGVIVDEAALAFARALETVEPLLEAALARIEQRRAVELERGMIRDLQRAFRSFYRHRPNYSLLPVGRDKDAAAGPAEGETPGAVATSSASTPSAPEAEPEALTDAAPLPIPGHLLPPGPLARVLLRPQALRLGPGETRRITAVACDATSRPVEEPVAFHWAVDGPVGRIAEENGSGSPVAAEVLDTAPIEARSTVLFSAGEACAVGALVVTATSSSGSVEAEAEVEVTDDLPDRGSDEGIPDPELVDAPGERWRSRMQEGRWQVNAGHPDFREASGQAALKLRYLAMLFAKEVVIHDRQDPRLDPALEELVEIATYADRQFVPRRRPRGGKAAPEEI